MVFSLTLQSILNDLKQVYSIGSLTNEAGKLLLVRIGAKHVGLALTDEHGAELYGLSWHSGEAINDEFLKSILPAPLSTRLTTRIAFDYCESVLVPQALHQQDANSTWLEAAYGVPVQQHVAEDTIANWQIRNIYCIPGSIKSVADEYLSAAVSCHAHTVGISTKEGEDADGLMLADFAAEDFSLIVFKNNQVLLAQRYTYTTPADVLYRLLKIADSFDLSTISLQLQVSGLIDIESGLYKELHQYFMHLHFRTATWSAPDNSYPSHFFTALNDLARCAL
ncbi:MAG: DUF3822 family protein [Cytophagaceae bacterium]|nr:MAG: DUF3822 family protein [Cytophagaceae bacterium]